jgi:hypothetical protein
MLHLTYGEKTLFVGDEAGETLLEYAGLLGNEGRADTVHMTCIGSDGNTIEATFLLNSGTLLVSESTNTEINEPDASDAIAYMRERIAMITDPPPAQPSRSPVNAEEYGHVSEL